LLREYGVNNHLLAALWAMHHGLKLLLKDVKCVPPQIITQYEYDKVVLAVANENEAHSSASDIIALMSEIYGRFTSTAFILSAYTANASNATVRRLGKIGSNLGIGIAIAEEIKDLLGEHGRSRAYEAELGRKGLVLQFLQEERPSFGVQAHLGHALSETEYRHLLSACYQSGALQKARETMVTYLRRCTRSLRSVVSSDCFHTVKTLASGMVETVDGLIEVHRSGEGMN